MILSTPRFQALTGVHQLARVFFIAWGLLWLGYALPPCCDVEAAMSAAHHEHDCGEHDHPLDPVGCTALAEASPTVASAFPLSIPSDRPALDVVVIAFPSQRWASRVSRVVGFRRAPAEVRVYQLTARLRL